MIRGKSKSLPKWKRKAIMVENMIRGKTKTLPKWHGITKKVEKSQTGEK